MSPYVLEHMVHRAACEAKNVEDGHSMIEWIQFGSKETTQQSDKAKEIDGEC